MKRIALLSVATYSQIASAQQPPALSSVTVPPISEATIVFSDRGRTYFAGTATGKVIVIEQGAQAMPPLPVPAPEPAASLPKMVSDSITAIAGLDAASRKQGAEAMIGAIDTTLSEAGGLNITDPQVLINKLAENAESSKASSILKGWKLGDILAGQKIATKDQLVKALSDVKQGLGTFK
jgi:hypothetical protein